MHGATGKRRVCLCARLSSDWHARVGKTVAAAARERGGESVLCESREGEGDIEAEEQVFCVRAEREIVGGSQGDINLMNQSQSTTFFWEFKLFMATFG